MNRRASSAAAFSLGVIITPFLDMAFQLLAFFIMIYSPSALEAQVDGKLVPPKSAQSTGKPAAVDLEALPNPEPEATEKLTVQLKSAEPDAVTKRQNGGLAKIVLRQLRETRQVSDTADSLEKGLQMLEIELKRLQKLEPAGKSHLTIEADAELSHGNVIRVFDVCRSAGYANISFAAPRK